MSHKGNQNLPENKDPKIPANGEDSKETGDDSKRKDSKQEVGEETAKIIKTRSSRRSKISSDENDLKSKKEEPVIEEINEEKNNEVEEKNNEVEETDIDKTESLEETPKAEELNGTSDSPVEADEPGESADANRENNDATENSPENQETDESSGKEDSDTSFMEPLVLSPDEPCPELEFEESSDKESEKHSPVLSRCTTRRSQNRKIPTPNTPRMINEPVPEKELIDFKHGSGTPAASTESCSKSMNFNETDNSSENVSMTVRVGGNETRTDFSEGESDLLQSLRSKGSNSSSRYLSSRRSLRSLRNDTHSKSLRDSLHRGKLYVPSPLSRDSIERAPSVKRKERSETPEDRKKFKTDSSGFFSKLSSPLSNLKNKFSTTPTGTSTPKLTSYKDEKNHIDGDYFDQVEMPQEMVVAQNKWCQIM